MGDYEEIWEAEGLGQQSERRYCAACAHHGTDTHDFDCPEAPAPLPPDPDDSFPPGHWVIDGHEAHWVLDDPPERPSIVDRVRRMAQAERPNVGLSPTDVETVREALRHALIDLTERCGYEPNEPEVWRFRDLQERLGHSGGE